MTRETDEGRLRHVNRGDLGTSFSCFGCENKKWRTFHSFQEEELGEIIAKNMATTARTQLEGRHLLFGEL